MTSGDWPFLIVDDEPEMCWIIEQILKTKGFACETAFGGLEAIALMKRQPFRMAFLDSKLRDVDGIELARRIRELDPSLPIIIISGFFYKENVVIHEAKESGLISAFISKPFEHSEILRAIELYGTR